MNLRTPLFELWIGDEDGDGDGNGNGDGDGDGFGMIAESCSQKIIP
jgi:hypothetical protein